MAIVPKTLQDNIQFFTDHITPWTTNSLQIGLVVADLTALNAKLAAASTAYGAATAARNSAKAATEAMRNAIDDLNLVGAGLIAKIKTQAETTHNPNVYVLAQIPAPATPTPAPDPTPPTDVNGSVNNDGAIQISWTATRANGRSWSVWRRLPNEAQWVLIASTEVKKWTDGTVPAGVAWAQYQVKSHRGAQVSEGSEPVIVLLGQQMSQAA